MTDNIQVRDANNNIETMATVEVDGVHRPVHAGYEEIGGKMLVGTAKDKFYEQFVDFDTSVTGNWELVQTGSGQTITGPLGGGAAGASPYININSGVTVGKTIILSRQSFRPPVELRYQITASQRIAGNRLIVGFIEVDDAGAIVTSTTFSSSAELLDARNAAVQRHDGVTATTAQFLARAGGGGTEVVANAFGTGFTTVATGTGPNFIAATTYMLTLERDKVNSRALVMNASTNAGGQFAYDRMIPNPNKLYKIVVIVENDSVPASATDWRLHSFNVLDSIRFDVSPRMGGTTDGSKSFPIWVAGGTLPAVTTITTAGTPAAPTSYTLNSAATTNLVSVSTTTTGLQAFYATNIGATPAFVKLYNKASAPVLASDVPVMIIPLPAAVGGVPGFFNLNIGFNGFRFASGIALAVTGGVADTDATAVALGQVKINLSRTA